MLSQKEILSQVILLSLSLIYFIFLYQFYNTNYVVSDYLLYADMHKSGLPAINAYSSLFVLLASIAPYSTVAVHILMLVFLTLGLLFVNIGYFVLTANFVKRMIFMAASFSVGSWYYFYGKLYYDFPFFAITFSMAFLIFAYSINSDKHSRLLKNIFYILCGFAVSWKAYFIFAIISLVLFGAVYSIQQGKINITFKSLAKEGFLFLLLFFAGYCIGNFTILTHPALTLKGLRGEEAHASIFIHLFHGVNLWDNANSMSFNQGVIFIPSLIIFVIIPFFSKKTFWYGLISIFIITSYLIFLKLFSTGLLWHGFSIGFMSFLLVGFTLLSTDFNVLKYKNIVLMMVFSGIVLQVVNNYNYIDIQSKWHKATKESMKIIEDENFYIAKNIHDLSIKYGQFADIEIYPVRYKYGSPDNFIFFYRLNESYAKNKYVTSLPRLQQNVGENSIKYTLRVLPKPLIKYNVPFYFYFESRIFLEDFGNYYIDGVIK